MEQTNDDWTQNLKCKDEIDIEGLVIKTELIGEANQTQKLCRTVDNLIKALSVHTCAVLVPYYVSKSCVSILKILVISR